MKKRLGYIVLCAFFAVQYSCDTDYYGDAFENDPTSGWVEFKGLFTQVSTGATVSIPLIQQSPVNEIATTITYTVTQAANSIDTAPASVLGTFTTVIPKNEVDGAIVLEIPADNLDYTLEITLVDTSQDNLILGLEGNTPEEHPIVHTVQVCDGTIKTSYTGMSYIGESLISTFQATLTPVPGEDNTFNIDTAWGTDFVANAASDPTLVGQFVYSGTLTVNDDRSVIIVADDQANFPNGGTGTYDPCTKTFNLVLTQELFSSPFDVPVVLTAN